MPTALVNLNVLKIKKPVLKRPVIFVPGWSDESCGWWINPNPYQGDQCVQQWIQQVFANPEVAKYIDFVEESPGCKSFIDFGEFLKNKIQKLIGEKDNRGQLPIFDKNV